MLTITEAAVKGIHQMMEEDNKKGSHLRIYAAGMSCSGIQYALAYDDNIRENDEKLEVGGITFLMDDITMRDLDEATLEYIESPNGGGLYFNKPNAGGCSTCNSCG